MYEINDLTLTFGSSLYQAILDGGNTVTDEYRGKIPAVQFLAKGEANTLTTAVPVVTGRSRHGTCFAQSTAKVGEQIGFDKEEWIVIANSFEFETFKNPHSEAPEQVGTYNFVIVPAKAIIPPNII